MTRYVGLGLELFDGPSDPAALADAILAYYDTLERQPQRIVFWNPLSKQRPKRQQFNARKLHAAIADPTAPSVHLWNDVDAFPSLKAYLRFIPDPLLPGTDEYEKRWFAVTSPAHDPPVLDGPLLELLRKVASLLPIVQGSVGAYRSGEVAMHDCCMGNRPRDADEETAERIKVDDLSWTTKRRRLRRLYPVTIIGPELWAELPPMPDVTPAPRVEELGKCKMITTWPTLCHPRDPDFLRGTRALREWLWPHTIKNPADDLSRDPA